MIKRAKTETHPNIFISSSNKNESASSGSKKKQLTIITNTSQANTKTNARKGSSQSESAMFAIRVKNSFNQCYQSSCKKQILSPMTPKYRQGKYIYDTDKTYSNKYMQKQKSIRSGCLFKFDKNSLIPCQNQIESQSPQKNNTQASEQQRMSRWATTRSDRQQLSQETIEKLSEFIEYRLQRQKEIQMSKQQFLAQMQKYPLQIKQEQLKQISQKREEQQQKLNSILAENKRKYKYILQQTESTEIQNQKFNIFVIQLISNRAQLKQLQKQIIKIQDQIATKQKLVNEQYRQFQQKHKKLIFQIMERNTQIQEKLNRYQQQISDILDRKNRIQIMKHKKEETIQQNFELHNVQKDLIKNSSINDLKVQLQSLEEQQQTSSIKLPNRQIKQNFYMSIRKKLGIIKNTISTQSQNLKFLNSLKFTQKESQVPTFLTPQSNALTDDQIKMIQNNRVQFKRYRQYLKQDSEILKLQQILNNQKNKYQRKIKKGREQIEQVKLSNNQCVNKINDLDNMQKIRSAQIQQLKKIANNKQQQIDDYQRKMVEQKKFDSFRDVLVGVSALGGLNMPISSKNKIKE